MTGWIRKILASEDPARLRPWRDARPPPQGEAPEDRPDVPVRPVWHFLMYFIMGAGFDALFPTDAFPEGARFTLGAGLVAAGAALRAAAIGRLGKAGTRHETDRPARVLVTEGPYRLSRNPIYLGLILFYLGLGVFLNNFWIFALAAPLFATIHAVVVAREEEYLEGKFGEAYRAYRERTRRWL